MIERLRAAWAAFNGGLVLSGQGYVVLCGDTIRWDGMTQEDAATALYRAADALVDSLSKPTIH